MVMPVIVLLFTSLSWPPFVEIHFFPSFVVYPLLAVRVLMFVVLSPIRP